MEASTLRLLRLIARRAQLVMAHIDGVPHDGATLTVRTMGLVLDTALDDLAAGRTVENLQPSEAMVIGSDGVLSTPE